VEDWIERHRISVNETADPRLTMSTPLARTWQHPSHPDIQEVVLAENDIEFTSKSASKISLPPFGLFAKLTFPPCVEVQEPTYATVQFGKGKHLSLNSDLVYTNHSCEPSLIFDHSTSPPSILAGPNGLKVGQELTYFYPSTEWEMAQPFDCLCGTASCKGLIDGAGKMGKKKLEGVWLNGYIREMLDEQEKLGEVVDGTALEASKIKNRQVPSNRETSGELGGDTSRDA